MAWANNMGGGEGLPPTFMPPMLEPRPGAQGTTRSRQNESGGPGLFKMQNPKPRSQALLPKEKREWMSQKSFLIFFPTLETPFPHQLPKASKALAVRDHQPS